MIAAGLVLLCNSWLHAQSVFQGKVYDAETKETIPGVNVVMSDRSIGTITDFDGHYSIKLPSVKCVVQVSYIGYETITIQEDLKKGTNEHDFYLKKSMSQIGEVAITAKSEARKKMEQGLPVTVLKPEDMLGVASDIKSVLTRISGVKIKSLGGVGSLSKISIRGLEGKRVGFYIEGKPLNDQSDFLALNDIPLDMIEQIEIYKGVIPAKFGGSAMGGAVNLILKEYPTKYVDYSYEIQSYNTHKTQFVLKNNRKDAGVQIGVGGFYVTSDNDYMMDVPNTNIRARRDHDSYNKLTAATGLTFTKTWFDEMKFEAAYMRSKKEIQGLEINVQDAHNVVNSIAADCKIVKNRFFVDGLEFEADLALGFTDVNHIDTAMCRYNWKYEVYAPVNKYGGEVGTLPNDGVTKKFTTVSFVNLNYVIDKSNVLNFHTANTYINSRPEDLLKDRALGHKTNYDSKVSNTTIGLTYDYKTKNDKWLSSLCGKYYNFIVDTKTASEYYEGVTDINTNKSYIGLVYASRYRLNSKLIAKGSLAWDVRMPSQKELVGDGFLITPSKHLEPERNKSINLGLLYDRLKSNGNRLEMEMNVFFMDIEDMIKYDKGTIDAKYINFGEMTNVGVECEIKGDAYSWLYAYVNATYQDLRDARDNRDGSSIPNPTKGDRMPNQPHFYANAGLELHKENFFGGRKQNSKLFFDYAFVEEFFNVFQMSEVKNKKVPRSSVFNIGIEQSFNSQKWTFAVQVDNLLDKEIYNEYNYPLPGRWLKAKIRYLLK